MSDKKPSYNETQRMRALIRKDFKLLIVRNNNKISFLQTTQTIYSRKWQ